SHTESANSNCTVSWPIKSPLKLASLAAGIPIVFLGQEFDSNALVVLLTLVFFVGPYVAIAFVSRDRRPFQVGFSGGYGLSMVLALCIYFVLRSFGAPVSSAPVVAYGAGLLFNFLLLTISLITWIKMRKTTDNGEVFAKFAAGCGYPFLAFLI